MHNLCLKRGDRIGDVSKGGVQLNLRRATGFAPTHQFRDLGVCALCRHKQSLLRPIRLSEGHQKNVVGNSKLLVLSISQSNHQTTTVTA